MKARACLVMAVLGLVALSVGVYASASGLAVKDAADARDTALTYLWEHDAQDVPSAVWQEEDITPPGLVGGATKEFTADGWTITVSYAVLPLDRTVYEVVVSSSELGWQWKGSVEADGSVTEDSAPTQMSEEESQKIAEEFLRDSPTFVFDGIEDTLRLADTLTARCPYCWAFIFEFDSGHPGYGDRTGQVLAQVITPHRAVIVVERLEIISAVMDDEWDMICQEMVAKQEEPETALSVSELLENPVYDTEVKIYGEVGLLGELLCPCFGLTSGGQEVMVWYGLMVDDYGIERAPVSVEGIRNGDWVIVTGELKTEGTNINDFWAKSIEIME